jgi:hypothetical protein
MTGIMDVHAQRVVGHVAPVPCTDEISFENEPVLVLTRWAQKWLKFGWNVVIEGSPTTQLAKRLVKEMDAVVLEPAMYVEEYVDERSRLVKGKATNKFSQVCTMKSAEGGGETETSSTEKVEEEERSTVREVISRKVVQKLARKQKSNFSAAVAKVAYNKFGERPMSPANVMVTRKWLQKYLESQFKDLRTCDKNIAIDRALFLSFVPTKDFLNMRVLMETKEMKARCSDSSWGKVFQLRRGDSPL